METPKNFLGIPEVATADAQALILPIPFEATTSYGKGAKNGPKAILEASGQVELYDHELGYELQNKVKITTLPEVVFTEENAEQAQRVITRAITPYVDRFVVSLGGEHSITPAIIKPYFARYPDLSILYIDAHTDMREEWEGSKYSHACAARRCQEQGIERIIWVGIRNTAESEQQYIPKDYVNYGNRFNLEKILSQLSSNVYLSFDVDGLDIPYMLATGTPEPGGISFEQALDLMQAVAKNKNLVGADFNELAPIPGLHAFDFLVAKMIFKLIQYKFVL